MVGGELWFGVVEDAGGAGFVAGLDAEFEAAASGGEAGTVVFGFGVVGVGSGDDPVGSYGFDADAVVVVASEGALGVAVDDVSDAEGACGHGRGLLSGVGVGPATGLGGRGGGAVGAWVLGRGDAVRAARADSLMLPYEERFV